MSGARLAELLERSVASVVIGLIEGYRWVVSPLFGPACRFYPPCSVYALHAVRRHGVGRGLWLAVRRLGRCQPLSGGGYDPVPE